MEYLNNIPGILPKLVFGFDLLVFRKLASVFFFTPESLLEKSLGHKLDNEGPLADAGKHMLFSQAVAYIPPIVGLSSYLILNDNKQETKLGFASFASVFAGYVLQHQMYPFPTRDGPNPVMFFGIKMTSGDTIKMFNAVCVLLNVSAFALALAAE
jgi:hypothetical protein